MRVVGNDNDHRVVARRRELLGDLDRVVEHDRVVDRTLPVERMAVLVDASGFDHQHESPVVEGQDIEGGAHLLGQVGLIGKFRHRSLLEEEAVERAVDIAGVEQSEQLASASHCRKLVAVVTYL